MHLLRLFSRGASGALFVKENILLVRTPGFTHLRIFPQLPPSPCIVAQDVFSFNNYAYYKLHLVSGS